MSSSLVFQSKELQTEPLIYIRQHYLNNLKLLFTFFTLYNQNKKIKNLLVVIRFFYLIYKV